MNNQYIADIDFNDGASEESISIAENKLDVRLPDDYRNFMIEHNGGEGCVGDFAYIKLWKIEEIVELNELYEVKEYTPNLIYFGSDGGDMAYAFDLSKGQYVEFPFMAIHEDEEEILGASFQEMMRALYKRK